MNNDRKVRYDDVEAGRDQVIQVNRTRATLQRRRRWSSAILIIIFYMVVFFSVFKFLDSRQTVKRQHVQMMSFEDDDCENSVYDWFSIFTSRYPSLFETEQDPEVIVMVEDVSDEDMMDFFEALMLAEEDSAPLIEEESQNMAERIWSETVRLIAINKVERLEVKAKDEASSTTIRLSIPWTE